MKPTQNKLGEDATGHRTHQETTVFLEEFGMRLEAVQPRGSKDCRDMEIWVPRAGIDPETDHIETVWEA